MNLQTFLYCRKAVDFWSSSPNLVLLGNTMVPRLPIFSFLIRHPVTGQFLHHNFVCAILNDVFGIQSRGGCACAGPYAQVGKKKKRRMRYFEINQCKSLYCERLSFIICLPCDSIFSMLSQQPLLVCLQLIYVCDALQQKVL